MRPHFLCVVFCVIFCVMTVGCNKPGGVEVDLTSPAQPRFIVDHHGWPRPFWWPRVTEFIIASEEDDCIWQLAATNAGGELANRLAFVFGDVPPGFIQVHPTDNARPKPLISKRSYYVAATGSQAVYRAVFALPVSSIEAEVGAP